MSDKLDDQELARGIARTTLAAYARVIHPRFKRPKHIELICQALQRVATRQCKRLCINLPPRHGKSLLASTIFPAWYLGQHPDEEIIHITYGEKFSLDFGRAVRNTIASEEHQWIFPESKLSDDSAAAEKLKLTAGGAYYAVGIGGTITGRGSNILLVDDAIKNREEADSETMRRKMHEWYTSTAYTRLMPDGAIVLVQTRWHEEDLAGWVLKEHAHENWEVLSLPAIAEYDEGWRKEGEPLWPEQFPLSALINIKATIGRRDWMALYQQRPFSDDGTVFLMEWLGKDQLVDKPTAEGKNRYIVVDPASAQTKTSDYTAMWVIGTGDDQNYYVLDAVWDKLDLTARGDALFKLHRQWRPISVGYEQYASQADVPYFIERMHRENYHFRVIPLGGKLSKLSRIKRLQGIFEARRFYHPPHIWRRLKWNNKEADIIEEFRNQYKRFPAGVHDDLLDALSRILDPDLRVSFPFGPEYRDLDAGSSRIQTTWMSA